MLACPQDMQAFKYFLQTRKTEKGFPLSYRTVSRHIHYVGVILRENPDFTMEGIEQFFMRKKEEGCKNTYINHIIPSIRYYADFKGLKGYKEKFPYLPEETYTSATMSDDEIEAFLGLRRPKNYDIRQWFRWTVFFSIMAYTGLRPGEVAHLEVNDIDFGLDVIKITPKEFAPGKTQKSLSDVPIPENLKELLKKYIQELEGVKLFPSVRGGHADTGGVVNSGNWFLRFKQRLNMLGIKRTNLTVYSLRHSYATSLGDAEVNVRVIQELMRHESILTTMHYLHPGMKAKRKGQNKLPLVMKQINPLGFLNSTYEELDKSGIFSDTRFSDTFRKGLIDLFFEESERLR